jgi:stage V sporulation protein B
MKKQNFLFGSLTLIASVIITKVIGAIFRIPLANMLGGTGMGFYSAAYGLFTLVYAFSSVGLPAAVAKLISETGGRGASHIRKTALILFGAIGLALSVLCIPLSLLYSKYIYGTPDALWSVLAIIPSVFFCSITSVLRGYYEGLQNFRPTAVSNIIESVIKLIFGLFLCGYVIKAGGSVALAAAAAVCGVSLSTLAGTLYLVALSLFAKRKKSAEVSPENAEAETGGKAKIAGKTESDIYTAANNALTKALRREKSKETAKILLFAAVPISLASLVTNLTNLIDITVVIPSLEAAVKADITPFLPVLEAGIEKAAIPQFIFGSFMGLAVTVFSLIPSFTNMFGKGILPPFSKAYAEKDFETVKNLSKGLLFTVSVIAIPCGLGISALSSPILRFLFPARPAETAAAELPLKVLGIAVIFLSISAAIFAAFQAAGRADLPVKLMCAGVVVKLAGNLFLVRIPEFGVSGAAFSTLCCYALIFVLSLIYFEKITGLSGAQIAGAVLPAAFCGLLCAVSAMLAYNALGDTGDVKRLLVSIAAGGITYILSGFLMGIFNKETLDGLTN